MEKLEIEGWKKKYNEHLVRHFKAVAVLDDNKIPLKQRDVWIPNYQDVLKELNYILSLFDAEGIDYTFDEVLGGFDIRGGG